MKKIIITITLMSSLVACKVANRTNLSSTSNTLKKVTHNLAAEFSANDGLVINAKDLEVETIDSFRLSDEISGVMTSGNFKTSGSHVEIIIGETSKSTAPPTFDIKITTKEAPCETVEPDNTYLSSTGTGIHCDLPEEQESASQGASTGITNNDFSTNIEFALEDQSRFTGFPLPPSTNASKIDEIAYCVELVDIIDQEFPDGMWEVCL